MLLEYLQKPTSQFCAINNSKTPLAPATTTSEYGYGEAEKISSSSWSLLRPAAKILRTGADVINNRVQHARDGLTDEERLALCRKEERRQILELRMKNAETMEAWRVAASELDVLEDNEAWKRDCASPDFDAALIEARTKQMDDARINCDIKRMLNLVRTSLSRDLGGMGNIRLYKHSHIGTKDVIERYIDSTLDTIRALVETSKYALPDGLETKDILEQVVYARQAFGRSALLLSGGATFGMNHIGVLKALFQAHLLPRIISGASAGSIVCAVLCTRTDEEIPQVLKEFPHGDLAVFEEEGNEDGVLERVRRLLTEGAWIDIKHLTRVMRSLLGDMTFQEAYNRSRRILNICVSSASVYELPRLLNYVTAPNVMIWSAVAASCSVPLLFSAAELLVKNPITGESTPWNPTPQKWIDGSVDNDLPMTRLAEMFNVNHFIVSQVNPHVIPFIAKDEEVIRRDALKEGNAGPGWVYKLTNLAKDEALHRLQVLAELGIFPNLVTKCKSILSQKYSGDITILPEIDYKDFPRILKNPTTQFMIQASLCGERATWPKLSRVRNHCAVELELDAAVQKLRARVVFSPSQVDLRRLKTTGDIPTLKRNSRKRTNSGSVSRSPQKDDDDSDGEVRIRKSTSRPPFRTSSSMLYVPHWTQSQGKVAEPCSTQPTLHGTPRQRRDNHEFRLPDLSKGLLPVADVSSAGETTMSPPSSDADIDSHTDESSPELEASESVNGSGQIGQREVDYFSGTQPITPGTDRVLVTSPSFVRHTPAERFSYFPSIVSSLEVSKQRKAEARKSVTEPNSPELRQKNMWH
ncbi:putative TGL4 Triacylglycerol lipase involved in TAG mobilization protein [Rutstroemia sp. NJR-2017a BVV2]|nr:putative TGL4 Triacylglycerol lipase involved in TAG mobilization protein [Rutstroemia sp. NJR-2017a BVV2]